MLNSKRWYLPLLLLLLIVFTPWAKEMLRVANLTEEARLAEAPVYSIEKARVEHAWVIDREKSWDYCSQRNCAHPPSNPGQYWEYLNKKRMLQDALGRLRREGGFETRAEVDARHNALADGGKTLRVRNDFGQIFGEDVILQARPAENYFDRKVSVEIRNTRFEDFCFGYLLSIPVMFMVFIVTLRIEKLRVWPELWRLTPFSIIWPIGLLVYPRDIRRENQIKLATHFVAQLASLVVALFGFGPVTTSIAKAQPLKAKSGVEKKKSKSSFGYGLEAYPQSAGIDAGLMMSPWYAHGTTFTNGLNVSGFGFIEAGERKGQFFTNHAVNISHQKSWGAMFTAEVGGALGLSFIQVGPRLNLVNVPGFPKTGKKVVKSVVAGSFWRIRGPTHYQEYFLGWASQEARLPGSWRISTEGFMRFRPGPRPAVGQPQIIFRHPKIKHTQFLSEIWMIGTQPTIRLGLQFIK